MDKRILISVDELGEITISETILQLLTQIKATLHKCKDFDSIYEKDIFDESLKIIENLEQKCYEEYNNEINGYISKANN